MKFGIELEAIEIEDIDDLKEDYRFQLIHDSSVNGEGHEVLTYPHTFKITLEHIDKMLEYGISVDKSCGVHVHISNNWAKHQKAKIANTILAICSLYEDRLYSVVPNSRTSNSFCRKIPQVFTANYDAKYQACKDLLGVVRADKYRNSKRYCWLNLVELYRTGGHQTIEFRLLGNTKRAGYIKTWVALMGVMVKYAECMAFNRPLEVPLHSKYLDKGLDLLMRFKNNTLELYSASIERSLSDESYRYCAEVSRFLV